MTQKLPEIGFCAFSTQGMHFKTGYRLLWGNQKRINCLFDGFGFNKVIPIYQIVEILKASLLLAFLSLTGAKEPDTVQALNDKLLDRSKMEQDGINNFHERNPFKDHFASH